MAKIKHISSKEILNAKGNPTLETTVTLDNGITGTASVPSGTSIGNYEAMELHDKDDTRYAGLGVLKAIQNVEEVITPKIVGTEVTKQQQIDKTMIELDGTQNKSRLGANAMLSVSIAVAKAAATSAVSPLFLYLKDFLSQKDTALRIPTPLFNLINGGAHADDGLDFQEFILIPTSSASYSQALEMGVKVRHYLQGILKNKGLSTLVGDEGGFGPQAGTNTNALQLLSQAVSDANYNLGFDAFLGIDAAANMFYHNGQYSVKDKESSMSAKNLNMFYQELIQQFHLLYVEDVLSEDDWEGWADLTEKVSKDALVVGDDLVATNPYRLQIAIDKKAITGVIIKPNQIGTVIEALAVVEVAKAAGLKIIVSHRSGETNDDFIADFAVAVSADYCKFGAPARGERIAKYNRLLQIENQLKQL